MKDFFTGYSGRELTKVTLGLESGKVKVTVTSGGDVSPANIKTIVDSYIPEVEPDADKYTFTGHKTPELYMCKQPEMDEANMLEIYMVENNWYHLGWKDVDTRQLIVLAKTKLKEILTKYSLYRSGWFENGKENYPYTSYQPTDTIQYMDENEQFQQLEPSSLGFDKTKCKKYTA